MAFPDDFAGAAGAIIYCGMAAPTTPPPDPPPDPVGLPLWAQGVGVGVLTAIPGSQGAGGSGVDAFSGFTFREGTNELYIAASQGHTNGSDNRVVSFPLLADSPSWVQRTSPIGAARDGSPSTSVAVDVPYYPDGRPSARHTYGHTHWSEVKQRIMLVGGRYVYGGPGTTTPCVDGFDPVTNTWDPAGTYPDVPMGYYVEALDAAGNGWSINANAKWDVNTGVFTNVNMAVHNVRSPVTLDTTRNKLFGMCWQDGNGYPDTSTYGPLTEMTAVQVNPTASTSVKITFNPSAAYTQLVNEQPMYAGMCYDQTNDKFYFYTGLDSSVGHIYVITPNSGTAWDVSLLTFSGSTPSTTAGGLNGRIEYIPTLKGIVFMPSSAAGLYFIRTS